MESTSSLIHCAGQWRVQHWSSKQGQLSLPEGTLKRKTSQTLLAGGNSTFCRSRTAPAVGVMLDSFDGAFSLCETMSTVLKQGFSLGCTQKMSKQI